MNKTLFSVVAMVAVGMMFATPAEAQVGKAQPKTQVTRRDISMEELRDKIRGGWAGQMIGVTYGAATEFLALGTTFSQEIKPANMENSIIQDDLYVEMTFAKVMDEQGIDAPAEAYGLAFRDSKYHLWHANAGARRNLARGIMPPESGHPKYNAHADDIDFQIEADFIGLMCPGLPQTANKIGNRVGHVMNYGDGIYGGLFLNGMYAAAFFEPNDMEKVVRAGLACIPAKSKYAAIVSDVLDAWKADPEDWQSCWAKLDKKWDKNEDLCPNGAMAPLNIDAKYNGAYIVVGLLYGGGDVAKTLEITTRCGQDSDCNPSNSLGVLGVMKGYNALPAKHLEGVQAMADKKFQYTDYSFNDICASTEKRAVKAVEMAGGKLSADGSKLTIPVQKPVAARLEQWAPGKPSAILPAKDAAKWTYTGTWAPDVHTSFPMTTESGASAEMEFEGNGVVLLGVMSQAGGRADVYVDGKKHPIAADAWVPMDTWDGDLWRCWDLAPGKHTLRLVTRPDADERSSSTAVILEKAIIYKK